MTNDSTDKSAAGKSATPIQLLCTVLITGTQIGKLKLSKGHRLKIDADKARALNNLTPPAVSIDGV
ncbi:MAG TPA: hypothetical protein VGE67_09075 [Haloferula sp.]